MPNGLTVHAVDEAEGAFHSVLTQVHRHRLKDEQGLLASNKPSVGHLVSHALLAEVNRYEYDIFWDSQLLRLKGFQLLFLRRWRIEFEYPGASVQVGETQCPAVESSAEDHNLVETVFKGFREYRIEVPRPCDYVFVHTTGEEGAAE